MSTMRRYFPETVAGLINEENPISEDIEIYDTKGDLVAVVGPQNYAMLMQQT